MSLNILITGTSSGFGKLIADTLLDNGHRVVGSMRDPGGRNKTVAEQLTKKGAAIVEIDVTNDESVTKGVERAQAALESEGGIDVLINNAGAGVLGWQEAFTIENFQRVFDVNVFGVQRMTRAVLPDMKMKQSGTIIQISSLLGQFVMPFLGPYNASKHAVEAIAENYRVELSQFGIESLILQPGAFGTTFHESQMIPGDQDRTNSYGEAAGAPEQQMDGLEQNLVGENAPDPQMVADATLQLLKTPRGQRPFRTVVDGLGMGDSIQNINEASESAVRTIYGNFGMESLLQIK